jgi:hypothetical protein
MFAQLVLLGFFEDIADSFFAKELLVAHSSGGLTGKVKL